ncbi:hypothetical protein ACP179_23545 [Xenorhabdus stockiae]|uniref:hypothetical protein n=1 Tax=Xenorhabdus stockiae TaxID=351614 RepID=UPI003CEE2F09
MKINEHTKSIVLDICEAPSLLDATALFHEHKNILKGYKFIFASNTGTQMGYSINKKFSNGAVVRSLFDSDRVWVLDENTIDEMTKNGVSHFPIDYSISLDTMSFSYLEPYINGKYSTLPSDFKEVFDFISDENVNVDPFLYQIENSENLKSDYNLTRIYKKVKGYEFLRNFNSDLYLKKGVVSSIISDQELEVKAQKFMSNLLYFNENKPHENNTLFNNILSYLFKMILIQKNMNNASLEEKILELIYFSHSDMGFFGFREMLIAKRYFEEGDKFPFFNKIKSNGKDLLKTVNGMSWDLFHIRYLERSLAVNGENNARYFFPAILTFDKRFIDLLKMNSIKSIAINNELNEIQPIYKLDFYQEYAAVSELVKDKLHYYFSDVMKKERMRIQEDRKFHQLNSKEKSMQLKCEFMAAFSIESN